MKMLIINPNTTEQMTKAIKNIALKYKHPSTTVTVVGSRSGPRSIEGHYDEVMSTPGTLERLLESEGEYDAFVIACYSNHPAIYAARELTEKPVLGIAEASMLVACTLGHKFSIVTTSARWKPMLEDAVKVYGLQDRCASVRSSGLAVLDLERLEQEQLMRILSEEAHKAIKEDGAEVLCLGCAGMAGLDKHLQGVLHVPVLDGVVCAVKLAESLHEYGLFTSKIKMFKMVDPRETVNLTAPFSAVYER